MAVSATDLAKLILRLSVGGMMLTHGAAKMSRGVDKIAGRIADLGLPEFLAYGVFVGEVLAPVLLIIGVFTRLASLTVALNMIVAIALVHADEILTLNERGAWPVELAAFYLFSSMTIALLGPGRFAARQGHGLLA